METKIKSIPCGHFIEHDEANTNTHGKHLHLAASFSSADAGAVAISAPCDVAKQIRREQTNAGERRDRMREPYQSSSRTPQSLDERGARRGSGACGGSAGVSAVAGSSGDSGGDDSMGMGRRSGEERAARRRRRKSGHGGWRS